MNSCGICALVSIMNSCGIAHRYELRIPVVLRTDIIMNLTTICGRDKACLV